MQPDVYLAIEKAKNGDMECRTYLVESNYGLLWSIVRRFLNRGHEAEDLFQVGCIGLIKAIDKFDPSYRVQFSTYAVPLITGEIKRFIRDDGIIKVSRNIKELGIKACAAREMLSKCLGREPTVKEIAAEIPAEPEEVVMAMDAFAAPESLSYTADGERPPEERLTTGRSEEDTTLDRIAVRSAISSFPPRERQIIIMRYFLEKTQTEIAEKLGISQVQVSRIEKRVLSEMRKKLAK